MLDIPTSSTSSSLGTEADPADETTVAIVGAGFSGLCMAVQLKEAGFEDFVIYESEARLGGTWRDNTYPGCGCDIPSHLYSYSFHPKSDWSRSYGRQPEILAYLEEVAEQYDLERHIRYETEIIGATFDRGMGQWRLEARQGGPFEARTVVLGVGPLSRPLIPDFEGLDRFEGPAFHSARWPESFDLAGKSVAVVGTGASGVQIVPNIAERVEQLHVFQRTPPWVLPRGDRAYSDLEKGLFEYVPGLQRGYRAALYALFELQALPLVDRPDWMEWLEPLVHRHIEASIESPELRRRVTPDYKMGCKRILLSDDYYSTLTRENVELVDGEVARFESDAIETSDGRRRAVDAVIFATGFHVTDYLSDFRVEGLEGQTLDDAWRNGAEAYYGMSVAGFPNLFLMLGPNTGLGHNSMIFMMEAQARFIRQAIESLEDRGARFLDVHASVHRAFHEGLRERMTETVWMSGCESWYLGEDGQNTTLWPGYTFEYWWKTRQFDAGDYRFVW